MESLFLLVFFSIFIRSIAYRLVNIQDIYANNSQPYNQALDNGNVGYYGDPNNFQREIINEGSAGMATQELLFEGTAPRQSCPGMIGPYVDGSYYCTAKEYGYCDRRSGICFCNTGYQGIDCSECQPSYYRLGGLCYSKKLCINDCNNAGVCNYNNGTCACLPHRTGISCENKLCTGFSSFCSTCTDHECLTCINGYYSTQNDSKICSGCNDFDPRCSTCTLKGGCSVCIDSLLTSVRRSGYRSIDFPLPLEEETRELSISIPFGSKSPEIFAEAEVYEVVKNPLIIPLNNHTISCAQGLQNDANILCTPLLSSHIVCGNHGVFQFTYPNYHVNESIGHLRLAVKRSGGGYGNVSIGYHIKHFTTNDSDLSATAMYTSSQTLAFSEGVVEQSFLIRIINDNIVEENEVFQVYLGTPEGGGFLGPQSRLNVTIIDDDLHTIDAIFTRPINRTNAFTAVAGFNKSVTIQAALSFDSQPMKIGGELFVGVIQNDLTYLQTINQRNNVLKQASVIDNNDGTYTFTTSLKLQGVFHERIYHAFPKGLMGRYYHDAYFNDLNIERIDSVVNFKWGGGNIVPMTRDFTSVRWTGALYAPHSAFYFFKVIADDMARLWLNGDLLIDHFTQQRANREPARRVYLTGNKLYQIELEYLEIQGEAYCSLFWAVSSNANYGGGTGDGNMIPLQVVPSQYLYSLFEIDLSPVIVTVLSDVTNAAATECTGQSTCNISILYLH